MAGRGRHPGRALWDAVQPLLDHRAAEGLRVAKVDVQDVYDEFNGGMVDPEAIRAFLTYAYDEWNGDGPRPRYVLLVGDGHYDFTGVTGTAKPNLIPGYLLDVDEWMGETSADTRYVSVDGPDDDVPDMHLGRIPAETPADVRAVVDKTIAYETSAPAGDWQRETVWVADDYANPDGDFHALSDLVRQEWLPPAYASPTIYFRKDAATAQDIREAIKAAFGRGPLMLQWYGHGSIFRWGSQSMFNIYDVPQLAHSGHWPVSMTYACAGGYYMALNGTDQSLGETLVLTPDRGSVADLSPAGQHRATDHLVFNEAVVEAIFQDRVPRLGDAVDQARLRYAALNPAGHDITDTYILFGDPALELRLPAMPRLKGSTVVVSNERPRVGETVTLTVHVVNDGAAPAEDIVVRLPYDPARLTIIEAPGAAHDGRSVSCRLPALAPGALSLTVDATVGSTSTEADTIDVEVGIQATGVLPVRMAQRLVVRRSLEAYLPWVAR